MKKILLTISVLLIAGTLWSKEYNLNETLSIDLDSIDTIVFEISSPNMLGGFSSFDLDTLIEGGSSSNMELRLDGTIHTNKEKTVPQLLTDESGSSLVVSLYPQNVTVFGVVSRGLASFSALIPESFTGNIEVVSSSRDLEIVALNVNDFSAYASSGDIVVEDISANSISVRSSSGEIDANNLYSSGDIYIKASSGDINIGSSESNSNTEIDLSSGDLFADSIISANIEIKSSSGKLEISNVVCEEEFFIRASSGDIELGEVDAFESRIESSSGSIDIDSLRGGVSHNSSSGNITIGIAEITRDIDLSCSSGRVRVYIPENSNYDLDLKTNSGRISVDDPVLMTLDNDDDRDEVIGKVNDGGPLLRVRCSSGNISVENR